MSWVARDERTFLQRFVQNIVKQGKIPKHVAFILDGNRRYARGRNMSTMEGHRLGYNLVGQCTRWGLGLGVQEMTVYMFSIHNFSRAQEEVDYLMELIVEIFEDVLCNLDYFTSKRIRINVVGNINLLPRELQRLSFKVMDETRYNNGITMNCAIAYTARNEVTEGVRNLIDTMSQEKIEVENLSETELEKIMQNDHIMRPVDLLIRTGETRLSDFLLWQSTDNGVLCFLEHMLWPAFTYWTFLKTLLFYQASNYDMMSRKIMKPQLNEKGVHRERKEQRKTSLDTLNYGFCL